MADPKCQKLINPHLITYRTRVCLRQTIITSMVCIEHIVHTLVVSLATISACDIMKHTSSPQVMTMVNADPSTHARLTV